MSPMSPAPRDDSGACMRSSSHAPLANSLNVLDLWFLDSRDIWLAIDDITDCTFAKVSGCDEMDSDDDLYDDGFDQTTASGHFYWEDLDWLNVEDCDLFNAQLFYWLLIRKGAKIKPTQVYRQN